MSSPQPASLEEGRGDGQDERAGLLANVVGRQASLRVTEHEADILDDMSCSIPAIAQALKKQGKLSAPLAAGLVANYTLSIVSLAFVGHLGTQELAAAALGATLFGMSGKILLMGLCGALDTYASQAAGSGSHAALAVIFQRTVLFLLLHALPITALFFGLPGLLRTLGQPVELCDRVGPYLAALAPAVWIDAVYRPLNRILVAQRITLPQMWVGGVAAAQHVGATYLCVHTFKGGYLGAAYATVWSSLLSMLLLAGYVHVAGLGGRVWGRPSRAALQGWAPFARLAWASAAMKCIESWSFSLCTVVAGWLPDPDSAVAAVAGASVAFNLYGVLFMAFAAQSLAASTRVGNALGAGRAAAARLAAAAAAVSAPLLWAVVAVVLVAPPSQRLLISLFTSGADEVLLERMRHLLYLVVVLEFFDGGQTVLSGVVSGAGKQVHGFLINAVAYWVLAVPAAMSLSFLLKQGVEGLYSGMALGPACQCSCYLLLVWRLRWKEEAEAARRRVQEAGGAG